MRFEYVFALASLGLAVFNTIRAIWFWKQKQKIMMAFSLCFLVVALVAAAYMGLAGLRAEKAEEQNAAQQGEKPQETTVR